jgi:hypothetical protein
MDFKQLVASQWDRIAAAVCAFVGALCLLLGWIGISGTAFTAEQLPYIISGGIGSIFFLGLGGCLWLSADLRDEWRKLDSIEDALRSPEPGIRVAEPVATAPRIDEYAAPEARPVRRRPLVARPAIVDGDY